MHPYLRLIRPHQWIKNLVVLLGPALGFKLFEEQGALQTLTCFVAFCLASSSSYAINDVMDREADSRHPTKRNRPVASGAIGSATALMVGGLLIIAALAIALAALNWRATLLLVIYFVLILAYSFGLKQRVILDVIVIAVGFVLRAWAGAEAVEVLTSPWLIACTFTLCMFLGFGKRRCELAVLGTIQDAKEHRATLVRYTPELLNHLTSVSAGIAVVTFLLYTMHDDPNHTPPFDKEHLLYTLPLVAYGVFRYAMLTETGKLDGPTDIVLKDRPFQATILLWGLFAAAIVYETKWGAWLGLGG